VVTLSGPAPADTVYHLVYTGLDPSSQPATVTVPQGSTTAQFTVSYSVPDPPPAEPPTVAVQNVPGSKASFG
jgi:hypothetical protein